MSGRKPPASLPCPQCGHEWTTLAKIRGRNVNPARVGGAVLRGHHCPECQHSFVSVQRVASVDDLAEAAILYDEDVA